MINMMKYLLSGIQHKAGFDHRKKVWTFSSMFLTHLAVASVFFTVYIMYHSIHNNLIMKRNLPECLQKFIKFHIFM